MSSSSGERLVRVAYPQTVTEAEMVKGLLAENGIQSIVQRERGLGMPQSLMPGPCEILVRESAAEAARQVLADTTGAE